MRFNYRNVIFDNLKIDYDLLIYEKVGWEFFRVELKELVEDLLV